MFKSMKKQMEDYFLHLLSTTQHLYLTNVDRDILWDTYLNSFTDPVDRQHHNCNCCRQFIKNFGGIVAISDGTVKTVWGFSTNEQFTPAVQALNALVLGSSIRDIFVPEAKVLGTPKSLQRLETGNVTWEHFSLEVPKTMVNTKSDSREALMGVARDNRNVFKRSLEEISGYALETVLELIAQDSLYRGAEFKGIVTDFLKYKKEYDKSPNKEIYSWVVSRSAPVAILKIRNSAIGTLLTDLSEDKELDSAVAAFERMVAPTNYKRPQAIVTKRMIEEAEKTLSEMGLTNALERRYAVPEDIKVDKVLYVNRDVKKAIGVFEEMKEDVVVNPKTLAKVEEITIDKFISDVLPTAKNVEVLLENNHLNNFVSLVTAKDPETPQMFKWPNPFSWAYTNAVADSMKERVKEAGGRVDGVLRCSLSWNLDDKGGTDHSDLDLWCSQPGGEKIGFNTGFRKDSGGKFSTCGGQLDLDDRGGGSKEHIENIYFGSLTKMKPGTYTFWVNQFSERNSKGFQAEIEFNGEIYQYSYTQGLKHGENVKLAEVILRNGVFTIKHLLDSSSKVNSREKWGVSTNKFHKVSLVTTSPNHWDTEVGNKHYFFILNGVKSDENTRGFFNEFLKEDLMKNKRVFEVLGSKIKVEPSDRQLSGLGFSTTQRNSVVCKVESKFTRILKINF